MYPISSNTAQLPGASDVDRVSPFQDEARTPRPETERDGGRPVRLPVDEVRLSEEARRAIALKPVEPKPHVTPPGADPLTVAARTAHAFLDNHSRLAESPFGKEVNKLIRGIVHLSKSEGMELSEEAKKALNDAIEKVTKFLSDHPRIQNSQFGKSVAVMARGINAQIVGDTGGAGLTEAAREAHGFLKDHPRIAEMPLGEAVGKLVRGVAAQSKGAEIGDIEAFQKLAKRIGNFVENHPRLSESEFGDLVKDLVREIVAIDETTKPKPDAKPEVGSYLIDPMEIGKEEDERLDLALI
ncbi:MAG: hypothetical protein GKS01_11030 [Alphaproteobacteria bacterium]|nr:hypothetical protein [Alphaproteobacteria bacterium]